jgi:cell wall-associated NlpC family hydrolase
MSQNIQPGDLVFAHGKGVISRAIRIAEWLQWLKQAVLIFVRTHRWTPNDAGNRFNHVAIVDEVDGDVVYVIQAEAHGVTGKGFHRKTLDQVSPGGSYEIVSPPSKTSRARLLAFARAQVGTPYGFFTIVSEATNVVTPQWMTFRWTNSWICSALAAESLRFGGWLHSWPDIYQVRPDELYDALT